MLGLVNAILANLSSWETAGGFSTLVALLPAPSVPYLHWLVNFTHQPGWFPSLVGYGKIFIAHAQNSEKCAAHFPILYAVKVWIWWSNIQFWRLSVQQYFIKADYVVVIMIRSSWRTLMYCLPFDKAWWKASALIPCFRRSSHEFTTKEEVD